VVRRVGNYACTYVHQLQTIQTASEDISDHGTLCLLAYFNRRNTLVYLLTYLLTKLRYLKTVGVISQAVNVVLQSLLLVFW